MPLDIICQEICSIIERRTDCKVSDINMNLMHPDCGIIIADFLYIFSDMEESFSVPVFSFLEHHPFSDFTIYGLACDVKKKLDSLS